jgi:hypothetical protein
MAVGKTAWNERIKLLAGLFQSAATTSFAVGLLAPMAAKVYSSGGIDAVPLGFAAAWLGAVVLFHGVAQIILARLRD